MMAKFGVLMEIGIIYEELVVTEGKKTGSLDRDLKRYDSSKTEAFLKERCAAKHGTCWLCMKAKNAPSSKNWVTMTGHISSKKHHRPLVASIVKALSTVPGVRATRIQSFPSKIVASQLKVVKDVDTKALLKIANHVLSRSYPILVAPEAIWNKRKNRAKKQKIAEEEEEEEEEEEGAQEEEEEEEESGSE